MSVGATTEALQVPLPHATPAALLQVTELLYPKMSLCYGHLKEENNPSKQTQAKEIYNRYMVYDIIVCVCVCARARKHTRAPSGTTRNKPASA